MRHLGEGERGVFIVSVTPFTDDGRLDLDSIDRLTEFYLERGVSEIMVLGMMGEAQKLSAGESRVVCERVIRRVEGCVPVVVGVSSPGFAAMRDLGLSVMHIGAAGVMVAPPRTLRTDDSIVTYFQTVAEVLGDDVPFALQDFPLSTEVQITPMVMGRIIKSVPSCVMLKHEDWPGLEKITALRDASAAGKARRISILVGNGGLFLPEELGRGADGAMTGFAYPEMMVDVCAAFEKGDAERGHDVFEAYLPLVRYEQQPGLGLAVRKHVLAKRGAIASSTIRKPGPTLSLIEIAEIERLLLRQQERIARLN